MKFSKYLVSLMFVLVRIVFSIPIVIHSDVNYFARRKNTKAPFVAFAVSITSSYRVIIGSLSLHYNNNCMDNNIPTNIMR